MRQAEGELTLGVQDTLACIYLLRNEDAAAAAEYADLLAQDFQSAYALLGAGVAQHRMGNAADGRALLERGYAQVADRQNPDPQLSALMAWAEEILG